MKIPIEDSIYSKKNTDQQKTNSFFMRNEPLNVTSNVKPKHRSKVDPDLRIPDLDLSSTIVTKPRNAGRSRHNTINMKSNRVTSKTQRTMRGSGSTRLLMLPSSKKGLTRVTSNRNLNKGSSTMRRRATANQYEPARQKPVTSNSKVNINSSQINQTGSRNRVQRRLTHDPQRNAEQGVNQEYLGQLEMSGKQADPLLQNVYDSGNITKTLSNRRKTATTREHNMSRARKMSRKQSKNSFSIQKSMRKQSSVRNIPRHNRSMSRNMSQNKGRLCQEIPDDVAFEDIEFDRVKLNQLLDFVLRNFYRVESELTLNILLRNILCKFTKPKEIIRNSKLSNLIKRASSSTTIPVTKTTLETLRPFWKQVFANKAQMQGTIDTLFEVLLRKVGPIEFFDFFIEMLFDPENAHSALLETLFEFVRRLSPVILTHKQILVLLR